MASNRKDGAVFGLATAYFFRADVGTEAPTLIADLDAIIAGTDEDWDEIGHTSLDSILSMSSEGGEETILGTLQAPSLRKSVAPRTEAWAFNLAQWDAQSVKYYFGGNATLTTPDTGEIAWLHVPDNPTAVECAFLIIMTDGSRKLPFHAEKVEIRRGDDLDFSDTSSLNVLPLSVTPLNHAGAPAKYSLAPIVVV